MKKNETILSWLHRKEAKAGIGRTTTDGAWGKLMKILFLLSYIYTVGIHLLYLLSTYVDARTAIDRAGDAGLNAVLSEKYDAAVKSMILVAVLTVLLTVGLVLLLKNKYLPALILSPSCAVVLGIHFSRRMIESIAAYGVSSAFTYRHLIPLFLLTLSSVVYCWIGLHFVVSENKAYSAFVDSLYKQYSGGFDSLTEEQWDEFLASYEPPRKKKNKKS